MFFDTFGNSKAVFRRPYHGPLHKAKAASESRSGYRDRGLFLGFVVCGYIGRTATELASSSIPEDIFWCGAALATLIVMFRHRAGLRAQIVAAGPLALLIFLSIVSTSWSDDPATTLRRSLALSASASISLYAVRRIPIAALISTLAQAMTVLAILSMLLIILIPDVGRAPTGEWQGCFEQKNRLSEAMVIGILSLACTIPTTQGRRRSAILASIALMIVLLVGARSGTSLLVALAIGIVVPISLWTRRNFSTRPRLIAVTTILFLIFCGVLSNRLQQDALDALGKDETLTGRTDVWNLTTQAIADRPLLGYGYKVFWLNNGAADQTAHTGTWATQAHNGLIEIGLDLGIVGILISLYFTTVAVVQSTRLLWHGRTVITCWPFAIFLSFILTNCTEAEIGTYYDVTWVVICIAFFSVTTKQNEPPSDLVAYTAL